ncbi:hypothetical protein EGH24_01290 [Halonotius terrestris]|uniref:Uncharacterized protein n=1 Tax=Halonotius terrestris TaxID=2487750 RepID=A0A8J8P9D0_9EURY|nr:hypothetical protein [Halonotius terrestris]TQQ83458.1 hypothetical protein EGH24_01290 [Halonotius terrestris]
MVNRRKFLTEVGVVSGVAVLAGCSGNSSSSDSEQQQNETQQDEGQDDTSSRAFAPNLRVESIALSYGFSSGLSADIVVRNTLESGSGIKRVNVLIEAYSGDELLADDNTWEDIQSELTRDFELSLESISESADDSIDDVTEFVVQGKQADGPYNEVTTLSGDELRTRVDN